jgi:hypothetical protein
MKMKKRMMPKKTLMGAKMSEGENAMLQLFSRCKGKNALPTNHQELFVWPR